VRKNRTSATIRVTCPACGDLELRADQVQVLINPEDQRSSYAFRCTICEVVITKPADERVVRILVSSGVAVRPWRIPAEVSEQRHGQPISWDDILELHTLLADPRGSELALDELARYPGNHPAH
jgi:uncharacterized Zn finger protein